MDAERLNNSSIRPNTLHGNNPADEWQEILLENSSIVSEPEIKPEQARQTGRQPSYVELIAVAIFASFKQTASAIHWLLRHFFGYFVHHPNHAALNAVLLGAMLILFTTGAQLHDELVTQQVSDKTVGEIIKASRFTRQYRSQSIKTRGLPEFLRVGAPRWTQREAVRTVLNEARKANLDIFHQAVLLATVEIESGFNPMARAESTTACGLFQFVRNTGLQFGLSPNECMDPVLNSKAGIDHYLENYSKSVEPYVWGLKGSERLFAMFERSYYLHHDGPNSSSPSADLKATVLTGTQFLFQAHAILEREYAAKQKAPTFAKRFQANIEEAIEPIAKLSTAAFSW